MKNLALISFCALLAGCSQAAILDSKVMVAPKESATSEVKGIEVSDGSFLVFSKKEHPDSLSEIIFSTKSEVHLAKDGAYGQYVPVVDKNNLFLMGYSSQISFPNRAQGIGTIESAGNDFSAFTTLIPSANTNGVEKLNISSILVDPSKGFYVNSIGRVWDSLDRPLILNGREINAAIALFKAADSSAMTSSGDYFSYNSLSKGFYVGVAGPIKTVGVDSVFSKTMIN